MPHLPDRSMDLVRMLCFNLTPLFFIPDLNQPNPIDEEHQLDQQAIDNNLVGNQEPFNLDLQLGMALIPQLEPQANIEGSISNNSTVSRPCLGSEAWAQFVAPQTAPLPNTKVCAHP